MININIYYSIEMVECAGVAKLVKAKVLKTFRGNSVRVQLTSPVYPTFLGTFHLLFKIKNAFNRNYNYTLSK